VQGFLNFPPLREAPGMGMAGVFDLEFVKEVHAESDIIFASIDSDGDGSISDVELREYLVGRGYADKAVTKVHPPHPPRLRRLTSCVPLVLSPPYFVPLVLSARHKDPRAVFIEMYILYLIYPSPPIHKTLAVDRPVLRRRVARAPLAGPAAHVVASRCRQIFAALDVNSDGDLSSTELRDAFVRYSALRFATGLEQIQPGDPEISVPPL